jgi:hypothetical protein
MGFLNSPTVTLRVTLCRAYFVFLRRLGTNVVCVPQGMGGLCARPCCCHTHLTPYFQSASKSRAISSDWTAAGDVWHACPPQQYQSALKRQSCGYSVYVTWKAAKQVLCQQDDRPPSTRPRNTRSFAAGSDSASARPLSVRLRSRARYTDTGSPAPRGAGHWFRVADG